MNSEEHEVLNEVELTLSPSAHLCPVHLHLLNLPDLIQAVRLNAVDQFSNPWLSTLRYLHHVSDFPRYCRTHEDTPLLLEYILKHISRMITDNPQAWMDADDKVSTL